MTLAVIPFLDPSGNGEMKDHHDARHSLGRFWPRCLRTATRSALFIWFPVIVNRDLPIG